jgi:hypothetical protein
MAMKKAAPKKAAPKKKGDEPVRAGVKKKQGSMRGSTGATGGSYEANVNKKANKVGAEMYGFRSAGKNRNPVKNFSLESGQTVRVIADPKRPQKGSAGAKKR